jgi:hypothetical protein
VTSSTRDLIDSGDVTSSENVCIPAEDSAVIFEVSRAAAKTCRSPFFCSASASADPRESSEHPVIRTVRCAEDIFQAGASHLSLLKLWNETVGRSHVSMKESAKS